MDGTDTSSSCAGLKPQAVRLATEAASAFLLSFPFCTALQELEEFSGATSGTRLSVTLHISSPSAQPAVDMDGVHSSGDAPQAALAADAAPAADTAAAAAAVGPAGVTKAVVLKAVSEGEEKEGVPAGEGAVAAGAHPQLFECQVSVDSPADLAAPELAVSLQLPGSDSRLPLQFSRQEVGLAEAAPLALQVVKARVIRWTNQLANGEMDRQQMEALRDDGLAPMRAELAAMQVGTWELGLSWQQGWWAPKRVVVGLCQSKWW